MIRWLCNDCEVVHSFLTCQGLIHKVCIAHYQIIQQKNTMITHAIMPMLFNIYADTVNKFTEDIDCCSTSPHNFCLLARHFNAFTNIWMKAGSLGSFAKKTVKFTPYVLGSIMTIHSHRITGIICKKDSQVYTISTR